MEDTPPQYAENLGHWIKRYSALANQTMDAALAPYGIGRTQWYILFHIYTEGPLSQRELQNALHIQSATLTPVVATLVRKGLIEQRVGETDKRSKVLYPTSAGRKLWRSIPDPIETVKSKALRGISNDDITKAKAVLQAAVQNLTKEG